MRQRITSQKVYNSNTGCTPLGYKLAKKNTIVKQRQHEKKIAKRELAEEAIDFLLQC